MEIEEINEIADAWIAAQNCEGGSTKSPDWWAVEKEMELGMNDPETLWKFIKIVSARHNTPKVIAALAAGPVENFLSEHGSEFIERIVEFARKEPKTGSDSAWERILAIRNNVW